MTQLSSADVGSVPFGGITVLSPVPSSAIASTIPANDLDALVDTTPRTHIARATPTSLDPVILNPSNLSVFYRQATGEYVSEWFRKRIPNQDGVIAAKATFQSRVEPAPFDIIVERDARGDGEPDEESDRLTLSPDETFVLREELSSSLTFDDESRYRLRFPSYDQTDVVDSVYVGLVPDLRPDVVDAWPYGFQYVSEDTDLGAYLRLFGTELTRLRTVTEELYEQQFLVTATGSELESLGTEIGVERELQERDDKLRYRIRLNKVAASSNGTARDVRAVLQTAFPESPLDGIEVEHVGTAPVTRFVVPAPLIESIPLTISELESLVETAYPCGHGVEMVRGDTFLFGESGGQGLGDGKLS